MPRRLHVTKLVSVGAVTTGDNPLADILFFKSKQGEPLEGRIHGGGLVAETTVDLSSLDDDTKAAVEAHVAEADAKVAKLETTVAQLRVDLNEAVVEEEAILPDDLPEAVAKRLADQDAEIDRIFGVRRLATAQEEAAAKKKAAKPKQVEQPTKRRLSLPEFTWDRSMATVVGLGAVIAVALLD